MSKFLLSVENVVITTKSLQKEHNYLNGTTVKPENRGIKNVNSTELPLALVSQKSQPFGKRCQISYRDFTKFMGLSESLVEISQLKICERFTIKLRTTCCFVCLIAALIL